MKAVLVFVCLALCLATIYAQDCDPNGNNKPICTRTSSTKIRNGWDPTHYWTCADSTAVSSPCAVGEGFDGKVGDCVPWKDWDWYPVCPESK